jgi:hypothetical protein
MAAGGNCDQTLAAARARWQGFCASSNGSKPTIASGCGGFVVVTLPNVDTVTVEYFDEKSGNLVAMTRSGPPNEDTSCVAGPSSFNAPSCASSTVEMCPGSDAGTD